jgi:hypothetical protein
MATLRMTVTERYSAASWNFAEIVLGRTADHKSGGQRYYGSY